MNSSSAASERMPKLGLDRQARDGRRDALEVERAELGEQREHPEDERVVTDAVDDERLLAGVVRRLLLEPEADQQIRAEADALPADEHHREVRAEHQHEHERGEQVQIGEVARELAVDLVVHVRGRVDVDQRADAGDDEDHHRRQRIDAERERDVQIARRDPGVERLLDRPARRRQCRPAARR